VFDLAPEIGALFDKIRPGSALGDDQEAVAAFNNVLDVWEFVTRHDKETVCRPVDLSELVGCGVTLGYLDTSRYLSVPARRSIQYGAALRPSRIDRLGVLVLGAVLGAGEAALSPRC